MKTERNDCDARGRKRAVGATRRRAYASRSASRRSDKPVSARVRHNHSAPFSLGVRFDFDFSIIPKNKTIKVWWETCEKGGNPEKCVRGDTRQIRLGVGVEAQQRSGTRKTINDSIEGFVGQKPRWGGDGESKHRAGTSSMLASFSCLVLKMHGAWENCTL